MGAGGGFEVATISEITGAFLYRRDFGVQSLGGGVDYTMREIGQDIHSARRFRCIARSAFGL